MVMAKLAKGGPGMGMGPGGVPQGVPGAGKPAETPAGR
jgi:hypothetical protein